MEIDFLGQALDDIEFWKKNGNKKIQNRISKLLDDICQTPFSGLGKPEPLKHKLSGYWSRRITEEHHIVYTIHNDRVKIISLRFHYR